MKALHIERLVVKEVANNLSAREVIEKAMSAAEVRREDQVLINEFGRLNAHARELREERALLQKRLEEVDDATTELAMGDGDDVCIPRRAAAPAT